MKFGRYQLAVFSLHVYNLINHLSTYVILNTCLVTSENMSVYVS